MNNISKYIPQIEISEFDYNLPENKIAKYPLKNREESKLLFFNGEIESKNFIDLPNLLPTNSLLVFNNTRVVKARMLFQKETGAKIEIFCLEQYKPVETAIAFSQKGKVQWKCLVGSLKKWKEGKIYSQILVNNKEITLEAQLIERLQDSVVIEFNWDDNYTFSEMLENIGQIPIPPYLQRSSEEIDETRYQTVYSKSDGSVAAPTAGLHFTDNILNEINNKGIKSCEITLHVGAGTFKPVQSEKVEEHLMHTEAFEIDKKTLELLYKHDGPIIAVGTTTTRTLESIYQIGLKIKSNDEYKHISQWDGFLYEMDINFKESLKIILEYLETNNLKCLYSSTSILLGPGYKFKTIDGLITNFHQPKSTLLLLISALVNDKWKEIYDFALKNDYRFLSYGDSSLLLNSSSKWF